MPRLTLTLHSLQGTSYGFMRGRKRRGWRSVERVDGAQALSRSFFCGTPSVFCPAEPFLVQVLEAAHAGGTEIDMRDRAHLLR